ncbi:MAG: DUF6331 family protein [Fimbriiglobus sp.]|jgi:hypothetical protein|nr:DUF6331 family protein [Fimbriiglobus sp.]
MAAFPPPQLRLHIRQPLRDLFRHCERNCEAGCCGADAFDQDPVLVREWLVDYGGETGTVLGQFESLLDEISRHRGSVVANVYDGCFGETWQTPHDCLTYFAGWRLIIAVAVRGMNEPTFFDPRWLTETVVALRNAIVAEKAFDRLPILADALEEAGCDNREILDHLRANDDHGHHCWVLDLLSVG